MNRFYSLFLLIFCAFFTSCSYQLEGTEAPDNLIPKDTFTLVLQDMMVVESYIKQQQNNVNKYYKSIPLVVDSVFYKYNIDSSRFTQSMDYYSSEQEELIDVYNTIQDSITLEEASYDEK